MLNYKVKLTEPKGYDEISVEGLYLSTDLSYISGVTNLSSNLIAAFFLDLLTKYEKCVIIIL